MNALGLSIDSVNRLRGWLDALAHVLDLAIRLHVANVFFKSGLTKIEDWDKTVFLFQEEYRVPWLPPEAAAFLGTFGEIFFPVLLALGLAGRFAAASLSVVNVVAVIGYWHVLGTNEAALAGHFYWGALLLVTLLHGPGKLSLDHWLWRWIGSRCGTSARQP
ncbi:MAG: DoxX family protein [Betaproteobacteria bacterium]|nr:DoxX family protein [Betaproteobacteria bacterium]